MTARRSIVKTPRAALVSAGGRRVPHTPFLRVRILRVPQPFGFKGAVHELFPSLGAQLISFPSS